MYKPSYYHKRHIHTHFRQKQPGSRRYNLRLLPSQRYRFVKLAVGNNLVFCSVKGNHFDLPAGASYSYSMPGPTDILFIIPRRNFFLRLFIASYINVISPFCDVCLTSFNPSLVYFCMRPAVYNEVSCIRLPFLSYWYFTVLFFPSI